MMLYSRYKVVDGKRVRLSDKAIKDQETKKEEKKESPKKASKKSSKKNKEKAE